MASPTFTCARCGFEGYLRSTFVKQEDVLICNECAGTLTTNTAPLPGFEGRIRACETCEWCTEMTETQAFCSREETMAHGWNRRASTCEEHRFKVPNVELTGAEGVRVE